MRPTIEVITTFFNDSFLAPFFMSNYAYADRVRVIIDLASEDIEECEKAIRPYENSVIDYFKFHKEYDVQEREQMIFDYCNASRADWLIVPDSDEFIFCDNVHEFLYIQTADIVKVRFYQAFRNEKDQDLDPTKPPRGQRKYGDPDYVKGANSHQTKPIVFRSGKRVHLMPGHHGVWNFHKFKVSDDILTGQHWQMADPSFCVARRLSRKKRLSSATLPKGYAYHDVTVTEEHILNECKAHLNDNLLPDFDSDRQILMGK